MSNNRSTSTSNLYLLSFIDVMDRLDILMLEIRHLQQTIIYSLRAPSLYLPLRYEETYLFGDGWQDKIAGIYGIGSDEKIAREWVIRYPTSKLAVNYYCENEKVDLTDGIIPSIENIIKHRIGKIWMGDNWVRDQRRQYYSLYALQILKQHVLCDKIALARGALQANLIDSSLKQQNTKLQKPAFLILRKGVLSKVDEYVLILRNHKHQVGQSIEFGMPSDPHPSTERRRDMGIFMDFIFNRTIDIQRDILHLYQDFNLGNKNKKEDSLLMFHGWSQDTRVSTLQLNDTVNASYNLLGSSSGRLEEHPVGYINTSFWTPDRPDLHPIIAYPVAESVIRNTLSNLDEVTLSNNNDKFTELIINFRTLLAKYINKTEELEYIRKDFDDMLRTIAADLLAATVKGVAYLYSLFLTIIGDELASQLYVGKDIKLEMVYSLEQGIGIHKNAILWYLRLNIVAIWIEETIENKTSIEDDIIKYVQNISKELLDFLNDNTPLDSNKLAFYWDNLLERFSHEIKKSSTISLAKYWRVRRAKSSKEGFIKNNLFNENKKYFSRSTQKLNIRLQNYLFREFLLQKTMNGKPLSNCDIKKEFHKVYSLEIEKIAVPNEKNIYLHHPKRLFDHIYDIPYQAAYLRSIDMLYGQRLLDKNLFEQLHWDMELGRGLFAIALEFYMREAESPEQRLSLCVNQIAYIYEEIKDEINVFKLVLQLNAWLKSDKHEIELDDIVNKIEDISKDSSSLGANRLVSAFAKVRLDESKNIRQLELIADYKLKDLFLILTNKRNYNNNKQVQKTFSSLVQFLSLHYDKSDKNNSQTEKSLFYNSMLTALGDIDEKAKKDYEKTTGKHIFEKKYLPPSVKSVMLHRISMTNYTPISDPVYLSDYNDNKNGRYLAKNLKRNFWQTNFNKENECCNTWITLGRFDAVSIVEVKLPCKCYIQGFEDNGYLPFNNERDLLKEEFAPHFSRREIARPVEIIAESNPQQMFAMISITLQRRSMRLDFLYRIIRSLKDNCFKNFQSGIEEKIKQIKEKNISVKGFLTDGWGDIVFKFSKGNKKLEEENLTESDIENIFQFQRAIYEDFMVDRTEIIFTPCCIDYTLAYSNKYKITLEARMLEDRWLETGVDKYIHNLQETIKALTQEKSPLDFLQDMEITMIPGRNDFSFTLIPKDDHFFTTHKEEYPNKYIKNAYREIIKWLDQNEEKKGAMRMLSHIETYIGKVIKDSSSNAN